MEICRNGLGFASRSYASFVVATVMAVSQPILLAQSSEDDVSEIPQNGFDVMQQFKIEDVPVENSNIPHWYGRDRCGLNCLYAFLQLSGVNVAYSELESAAGPVPKDGFTLSKLQELSNRFGCNAQVLKGDVSQVSRLTPPVIIHFGHPDAKGHFTCFAKKNGQSFLLLDGTSGGMLNYRSDSAGRDLSRLLRNASGYIMAPARSRFTYSFSSFFASCLRILAGCALGYLAVGIWRTYHAPRI